MLFDFVKLYSSSFIDHKCVLWALFMSPSVFKNCLCKDGHSSVFKSSFGLSIACLHAVCQLSPPGLYQTFGVKQILGLKNVRLVLFIRPWSWQLCGLLYSNVVISEISKGFSPILQMKLSIFTLFWWLQDESCLLFPVIKSYLAPDFMLCKKHEGCSVQLLCI